MKSILKRLRTLSNKSEMEGSTSPRSSKSHDGSSTDELLPATRSPHGSENKQFLGLSGWLHSGANRHSPSPSSSSNVTRAEGLEQSDSVSSGSLDIVSDAAKVHSGFSNSGDPQVEEEYQIQMALELSAKEDPEAVQIEAVKQISLGSCDPDNTLAEVVAYRYWNYNSLSYDDKILDGFYDLYGVTNGSGLERMPSLVELQGTLTSDVASWEAVLVNRAADSNLMKLKRKALKLAVKPGTDFVLDVSSDLVQKLSMLVAEYMGGMLGDPENMLRAWQSLSYSLKATLGSMVLPLGSLTIGLARHRALLFKVLADSVGIPCQLVKGLQYTGSDDVALNIIKINDGREYIVDLMSDPGTLIPSDAIASPMKYDESFSPISHFLKDTGSSHVASSNSGFGSSLEENPDLGTKDKIFKSNNFANVGKESEVRSKLTSLENLSSPMKGKEGSKKSLDEFRTPSDVNEVMARKAPARPNFPYVHARSPSWTEGVSSPSVHKMKVKNVSQYMMDAAEENPKLAQKLHDVLLESGVVAPPNLFSKIYDESAEMKSSAEEKDSIKQRIGSKEIHNKDTLGPALLLPPLPHRRVQTKASLGSKTESLKPVEALRVNLPLNTREIAGQHISSQAEATPLSYENKVPVAAAAAAAAAVVASSMVVAASKSSTDPKAELPVAAAATATAAAVVATTAAVSKRYEQGSQSDGDTDGPGMCHGNCDQGHDDVGGNSECRRMSRQSVSDESPKSDALNDFAEYDIPWEDITLGERVGLGSYGEVYHGDWHGTEVAIKRFLNQSISGESLEEFKSEVRIMKRLRHPNVVLFMGAVTRPPNLSIVTEFLPRGSLYRLIHRPNNQLDERRRLRMALDAARGMNYLHNCSPMIVHRDLKSPNLLVDKNWVVKVCDFGLSRMKHSTFLSSRSTAGTAEWMAPEVLRNEPSDEKCDVYSFGVILWELSTLRQPWGGMNPMQVVGAVGFQHRRLDIPDDTDPATADIIRKCWQTDPKLRPTFAEIMAALKPLQKPITSSQIPRPSARPSRDAEDLAR